MDHTHRLRLISVVYFTATGFSTQTAMNGAITAVWSDQKPASDTPYGTFTNGIASTMDQGGLPGHGESDNNTFELQFTLDGAKITDFTTNSLGYFFAADVSNPRGGTGAVASALSTEINLLTAVPEPSTWAMMILGFAGVGFMAYRRKRSGRVPSRIVCGSTAWNWEGRLMGGLLCLEATGAVIWMTAY